MLSAEADRLTVCTQWHSVYTAGTVTFAGLVVVFFLASEMSVSHTFLATSDVLSKRHPTPSRPSQVRLPRARCNVSPGCGCDS